MGDVTSHGDGYINVKTTAGTVSKMVPVFYANSGSFSEFAHLSMPIVLGKGGICLGDGDTAVTYEDHKLAGNTFDNLGLVCLSKTIRFDSDKKKYVVSVKHTFSNTTESDITIKEWGMFSRNKLGTSPEKFDNNGYHVLMFREVLDTPVTIAAGTTGTLTFSVDLPMPNHP